MPFAADHFLPALAAGVRQAADARGHALVAIDGRSLAGKTKLATDLLPHLGHTASILAVDSYFEPLDPPSTPVLARRWRLRADALRTALADLKAGRKVHHRPYDWDNDRVLPETIIAPGLVLAEGLGALKRELRAFYDFSIWVEGRHATRLDRLVARDGSRYLELWTGQWLPLEEDYVAAEEPWRAADLIVAGADITISAVGAQLLTTGR